MSRATEMHGFLPDDYVELKTQRRTNILWALIFLIVAGGIGWAYFIAQKKIQDAESINKLVSEQYTAAAKPIELFKQMQDEQQRLNQKAELVGSLIERVNRSNILATLTNGLPKGVYLSDFELTGKPQTDPSLAKTAFERAKAAGAPKPIIYAVSMRLRGYALNNTLVTDYQANLQKSPLFSEVLFVQASEKAYKDLKLREFELELVLDPAADSRASAAPKTATVSSPK